MAKRVLLVQASRVCVAFTVMILGAASFLSAISGVRAGAAATFTGVFAWGRRVNSATLFVPLDSGWAL
ncbi:MAG TPA: hypothetical protein VNG12_03505 [Acidimicrobiales bacterium]|nr:hypothetical protein [Acidimicrobiales bacterium]